jgi:ABC-type polysaccharide/polyol phosphate transport system ATPase subunit
MVSNAISLEAVWKMFRLYHEKNQYLKATLLSGRRSRYDEFWALKDVGFQVPHGSTFGIVGSNGSGKSTLLKILAGILVPDKGHVSVDGRVVALLELGAGFHPDLSGLENVFMNASILGMNTKDIERRFDDIVDFSGLGQFINTPVKNYSSGMVVRLGFAIAAFVDPEILLIDEVLAVGDASFQKRCGEKIEEFRRDGRTIVIVTHAMSQVLQLCDQAAWIEKGTIRDVGVPTEIVSEYSGLSFDALPKAEGEHGERWGSGEGLIESVRLYDSAGRETLELTTNKPATIQIKVRAVIPLPDAVVGIRITHLHGAVVWGCNTKRRNVRIEHLSNNGQVEIQIPALPLLEGTYELTVAFSDLTEVHEFDHWEKRIRFDVRQHDIFEEGLITVASNWSATSH